MMSVQASNKEDEFTSVTFSSDGSNLVGGTKNGKMVFWSYPGGRLVNECKSAKSSPICGLDWNPKVQDEIAFIKEDGHWGTVTDFLSEKKEASESVMDEKNMNPDELAAALFDDDSNDNENSFSIRQIKKDTGFLDEESTNQSAPNADFAQDLDVDHLFESIGLEEDDADELMSDLQLTIEEKSIPFTLKELANLNPSKTPKGKKTMGLDPLDFLCQSLKEQDLKHVLLWLTFGNGDGNLYIAKDYLKKFQYEEIVESIGPVDNKDKVSYRSAKCEGVWFKNTTIPEMSYGASSHRKSYKKALKSFPEKFQIVFLEKMNKSVEPPVEFTLETNFVEQFEMIYGDQCRKLEDPSGKEAQKLFKNLTPRRQKRTLEFMQGISDSANSPDTPSVSGGSVPRKKLDFGSKGAEKTTTENETPKN